MVLDDNSSDEIYYQELVKIPINDLSTYVCRQGDDMVFDDNSSDDIDFQELAKEEEK